MVYKNLKRLREEKGISQKEIAKSINCSQRAYSHYEKGDRDLPTGILIAIAKYFDVSIDYLLGLTEESK